MKFLIDISLLKQIIFRIWDLFFDFSDNCVDNLSALSRILVGI